MLPSTNRKLSQCPLIEYFSRLLDNIRYYGLVMTQYKFYSLQGELD